MPASTNVHVKPIAPAIGAVVEHIDLNHVDDQTFAFLEQALHDHLVLFFRDQDLTPGSHLALGRRFGEIEPAHPYFPHVEGHPQVTVVESDGDVMPQTNIWHTDVTWKQEPPLASILHAVTVPPVGGDTMWASMYAVYDDLGPDIQTFIDSLSATHDSVAAVMRSPILRERYGSRLESIREQYPPVVHPVVRVHPRTGKKALFVNADFVTGIVGWSQSESDALLEMLYRVVERPEHQVRFKWEPGSVAIWDNRCTQHYALADYGRAHRRMQRVTVVGDRPVGPTGRP